MNMLENAKLNHFKILPISAFLAYYVYLVIAWLEFYALPEYYISEYVRLDLATYSLEHFDRWMQSSSVYDFIIIVFPALLLWKNIISRVVFYGFFLALYIFAPAPNPNLTIVGLFSQGFYTFFIVGVGFVVYSDILRLKVLCKNSTPIISSVFYSTSVFLVAIIVAIASAFGARNEREEFVEQHSNYAEQVIGLTIGMSPAQILIFIFLSLGVFAGGKLRALLVLLSWVSLAVFVPMKVEWNTYFLLADIYTVLSAILFCHTLCNSQASVFGKAFSRQLKHNPIEP